MCIGTIFCEAIAISARIPNKTYFLPSTTLFILPEIILVNPECAIVAAKAPSRM